MEKEIYHVRAIFAVLEKKRSLLLRNFCKNAINKFACSSSVVVTHHLAKVAYTSSNLACCFFYAPAAAGVFSCLRCLYLLEFQYAQENSLYLGFMSFPLRSVRMQE